MSSPSFLVAFLTLAACGGTSVDPAPPTKPPTQAQISAGAGVPCEQEIGRMCGEGLVDACGLGLTSVHVCVDEGTTAGPPCTAKIALQCPVGQLDACTADPPASTNHVCVIP